MLARGQQPSGSTTGHEKKCALRFRGVSAFRGMQTRKLATLLLAMRLVEEKELCPQSDTRFTKLVIP